MKPSAFLLVLGLSTWWVPSPAIGSEAELRAYQPDHEQSWLVPSLHAAGLMTGMRLSEAYIWPEPFARTEPEFWGMHYEEAFTKPPLFDLDEAPFEWDGDRWEINVIGHGLFGSELYLRARQCRNNVLPSLLFTALASTTWEYGFEANGTRPSGLDLVYTPLSGLLFGELRYLGYQAATGLDSPTWRGVLQAVFDPFGEIERGLGTGC